MSNYFCKLETTEFISNPSNLSLVLVDIVESESRYLLKQLKSNFFRKNLITAKFLIYCKVQHQEFYKYLAEPAYFKEKTLSECLQSFTELQKKLVFHNMALALFWKLNQKVGLKKPWLMEDEEQLFLSKFARDEITKKEFDQQFGHYALNAYEFKSRRFREYSSKELKQLANLVKEVNFEKIGNPKKIYHNLLTKQQIYSNMLVIRSLVKYYSLQLIEVMRIKIIDLARRKRIKDFFDLTWRELNEVQ